MERAETAKRKGWASDSTWSLVGSLSSSLNRTGQDETYADSDSGSPADAGGKGKQKRVFGGADRVARLWLITTVWMTEKEANAIQQRQKEEIIILR
ncbi:hypothetical protein V497_02425 [Pseudogymnoascus sp. VKM F-4516 (FW-969)]|nr:hypothetical protein V497_02425 [Pseudogymnoascus sp. VKM F-4516 (FW-969)]